MKTLLPVLAAVSLLGSAALAAQGQQVKRPRVAGGFGVGYLEYLPQDYDDRPTATYPVMIFFHGIGENGFGTETDLDRVLNNSGGPPVLIRNGHHFPFIVISGQHNAAPNTNCWNTTEIDSLIEHVKTTYRVDPNRIYLTGLSCGAIGLWGFLDNTTLNSKAAAALPISGSGGSFSNTQRIDVPLWAFHGATDPTVQACSDDSNATAINAITPPVVPAMRATFVPNQGHTGWTDVYGNTRPGCNVYDWLLAHDKSVTRTARNVVVDGGTVGDPAVQLNGGTNAAWCDRLSAAPGTTWDNTSAGSCIVVTAAPAPSGKVFDHWDTGGVAVDVPATATANFVMPDQSLVMTPIYRDSAVAYVDTKAPKLWLTTPSSAAAYSTSMASLTLAGTAIDDVGVTQVSWVNSAGGSGNATLPNGFVTMRAFRAVIALTAGVNVVTFTARDAAMNTRTAVVTINRGAIVNLAPVVNAGPNAAITLPTSMVTLQGTASDDGLPAPMTLAWSRVSGPGTVTFTNGTTATAGATFSASGVYVLRLTATDTALTSTDDVTITVNAASFALTVTNGTGSGSFMTGAVAPIVANAAPGGQVFDRWTGDVAAVADAMAASTTVTMPASAVAVNATYRTVQVGMPTVDGFSLIDADTGMPLAGFSPLTEGAVVNLANLSTRRLDFRANTTGAASLRFTYDGAANAVQDTAPFLLNGMGTFALTTGAHTISATAFENAAGAGVMSPVVTVSFTVIDPLPTDLPPAAPLELSATATSATVIELEWADSPEPDFASYALYRDGVMVAEGLTESRFTDGERAQGTTYVYRVAAIDGAGQWSGLSAEVSVTTPTVEVPSPMENVLGGCGCTQAPVASLLWGVLLALSLRKRTVRVLP